MTPTPPAAPDSPAGPTSILLGGTGDWPGRIFPRVYAPAQRARLAGLVDLHPTLLHPDDLRKPEFRPLLDRVEFVFGTWGIPQFTDDVLALLPKLRAVFYAAGSVQGFARPLLARNITVVSAWAANAIPVAEFTVAQTILSLKRAHTASRALHRDGRPAWGNHGPIGSYGSTVALISLGMIGRRVLELLRPFDVKIIAYEPYPRPGLAESLGVELVSLDDCFARGDVVSLHAPNLPSTAKMIKGRHLRLMRPNTAFINTARAAIVDQDEMLAVLAERPDLSAVIDVTDPTEPPPADSPYYTLPNLYLTPHIAGSVGNEVARLGDYVIDEAARLVKGEPLKYAVSEPMLDTMA